MGTGSFTFNAPQSQLHMATSLHEAVEFMVANGYLVRSKNKYLLMQQKLSRDLSKPEVPAVKSSTAIVVTARKAQDWVNEYQKFIVESMVPRRCEGRNGEMYYTNQYSEPGMKAFRKAIEGGADYNILTKSTMLYYKSGVKLKQAIGRYMEEGTWRSGYDALLQSAEQGTVEQHIKDELEDGSNSFTQLG